MTAYRTTRPLLIAALAVAVLAAGCHKRSEEAPRENQAETPDANVTTSEVPPPPEVHEAPPAETNMAAMTAPVPTPKAKPPKAWPAPAIPPDEQTQDDADATGMTAHVAPDGGSADAGGNAR